MNIPASLRPTHGPMHVMPARDAMSVGNALAIPNAVGFHAAGAHNWSRWGDLMPDSVTRHRTWKDQKDNPLYYHV